MSVGWLVGWLFACFTACLLAWNGKVNSQGQDTLCLNVQGGAKKGNGTCLFVRTYHIIAYRCRHA